jgi:hypothetical protein
MDLSAFALRFAKGTLLILGLDLGERHLTMELGGKVGRSGHSRKIVYIVLRRRRRRLKWARTAAPFG